MKQAGRSRAVDWEPAPRALVVLLVTALATLVLADDSAADVAVGLAAATAFCVWLWFREGLQPRTNLAFGISLTVIGLIHGAPRADDIAVVLGATATVLSVPLRRALLTVLSLIVVIAASWLAAGMAPKEALTSVLELLLIGFVLNVLERIRSTAHELRRTQELLATERVHHERLRLSREVSGGLGLTLCAAADGIARARALVTANGHPVAAELEDLAALVAQGAARLELLSFEPVVDKLEDELAAADELCRRLGVAMTASIDALRSPVLEEFAALVLRESVTNMFKHARPSRCVIVVRVVDRELVISVTNDGVGAAAPLRRRPASQGSGQRRWSDRLAELGGRLDAGALEGGRYRVLVRIPVTDPSGT